MRKSIAAAVVLSLISVTMVAHSFAASFPVEKTMVIKEQLTTAALHEPMLIFSKPGKLQPINKSKIHPFAGVKPDKEARCNSPGHRQHNACTT